MRAATLDLTRTLDLPSVLDKLLEHLAQLVPYDTASAIDAPTSSIFDTLIRHGRSILVPDTRGYPDWQRHAARSTSGAGWACRCSRPRR